MIRIEQLKLPIRHTQKDLEDKIRKTLHMGQQRRFSYEILRQSLDARKQQNKKFVYTIAVRTESEEELFHKVVNNNIMLTQETDYVFPPSGMEKLQVPPIIVGSGPAGLFCAYALASHGYRPLVLERGEEVDRRKEKVKTFWENGCLDPHTNVQFGEGGAGTFSDGKLNTQVKDTRGRNRKVLQIFADCGAPAEILYQQKPHLGTDLLSSIISSMHARIEAWGGSFAFDSQLTDLAIQEGRLCGITINDRVQRPAQLLVLAPGHSARDTFRMLYRRGLSMEPKAFAVGVRVEHPQEMINQALYGGTDLDILGPASYKLTARTGRGRGAYTFCMCPGGYVINASSREGCLAVNGMSYRGRDGKNANSAVVVTVNPQDFASPDPLSGIAYQEQLESRAWELAGGRIPIQLYGDFKENRQSTSLGEITPCTKGAWAFANLRRIFPEEIHTGIVDAMEDFSAKIPDFNRADCVLSGVESRTSSPVRLTRSASFESNIGGIYPCGEGAGYAGGITSAAMDGLKIAEQIASVYAPFCAGTEF